MGPKKKSKQFSQRRYMGVNEPHICQCDSGKCAGNCKSRNGLDMKRNQLNIKDRICACRK